MPPIPLLDITLPGPPFAVLSYALPPWLPESIWIIGQRAAVPLGKGLRVGIISGIRRGEPPKGMKYALWPLEKQALLSPAYLEMIRQLALRNAMDAGRVLGQALPAPLRTCKGRLRFETEQGIKEYDLKDLADLEDKSGELRELGRLWTRDRASWLERGEELKEREMISLAQDPPWPLRPRAAKQHALLDYVLEKGIVSKKILLNELGSAYSATLTLLHEKALLKIQTLERENAAQTDGTCVWQAPFELNAEQSAIILALMNARSKPENPGVHLLHGVTGSGKTAIYLAVAEKILASGKSVLLLAPELALALKLRQDALHLLGNPPIIFYHGYQSPKEREQGFLTAAGASAKGPFLVIGTRSALFLPLREIGAIILDEEHDASFKQDEGLIYQSKEVAWFLAAQHKALLLLGSATPDVKSYHAAQKGSIRLHTLSKRSGEGSIPAIRLVHLPRQTGSGAILAGESISALNACVSRGEQAIILLNRRGYAPFMYCLSCNLTLRCPHCAISLTYHKGREKLVCHYCGHSSPFPSPCPDCGTLHFLPLGEGTEKLEESLLPLLPAGTRILRLDRDSTRRAGSMEEILTAFSLEEAQILVGTQMISKGHHFPKVTLAIAADADLGLNLPDYRAAERSFQLILQAAGRSGRGDAAGEVLIQTRDPNHYCWEFIRNHDYEGFYAREIALREKRKYPPFTCLALLRISFPAGFAEGMQSLEAAATVIRCLGKEYGVSVLGPAPAPLAMLNGRKRFHCLLKSASWAPLREIYTAARKSIDKKNGVRISLDPDPVNML